MRDVKVGIIGSGMISEIYLNNFRKYYHHVIPVAITSATRANAERRAKQFSISKVYDNHRQLLEDDEIEMVVNLTPVSEHKHINIDALNAGKHVFSEKTLAQDLASVKEISALAEEKNLLLGCAPDTFFGSVWQTARKIIDSGKIGKIHSANLGFTCHGNESWHTNPMWLYQRGGDPLAGIIYHMTVLVSLLGPIESIYCVGKKTWDKRKITSQPLYGGYCPVDVNTHYAGMMRMRSGVLVTMTITDDVWHSRTPNVEIHGDKGSMLLPDATGYDGRAGYLLQPTRMLLADDLRASLVSDEPDILRHRIESKDSFIDLANDIPMVFPGPEKPENLRGIGVSELAYALVNKVQPRTSSELFTHVSEALWACDISSERQAPYFLTTTCSRPRPLRQEDPLGVFNV